jgi:glycosyltransferase XagB
MSKILEPQVISKPAPAGTRKKLGETLVSLGYTDEIQVEDALGYQQRHGGLLGWILASRGKVSRQQYFQALAAHLHLPFVPDTKYLPKIIDDNTVFYLSHDEIIKYQVIPFHRKDDTLTVLTADPNNQATLKFLRTKFTEERIKQIVVTDLDITRISERMYREKLLQTSVKGLINRNPDESAFRTFTWQQIALAAVFFTVMAAWGYFSLSSLIITALFAVQLFYVVPTLFKLMLVVYGRMKSPASLTVKTGKPDSERNWPVYTILIAAYKEKEVIGNLIRAIKKIDYPENKLDIILLLEENDSETLEAAKAQKPPANWRILICPKSMPQTKPKALNYGLNFARGEFLTIFDAEDIPEPDQLKKAVTAFRAHPDNYFCFQAALNFFNKNENFLTKMFTLEYTGWFDCLLPGLFRANLPMPLGGTSNHFHVAKLKEIGAWDPYNVTEDADLGIRASMHGYKIGVIDSTTYEEANAQFGNWIRQRSRWVKGYMQTFLVHNRHPLKSLRVLGIVRWLSYTFLIGGTPVNFLLNPIMWLLFGVSFFIDTRSLFSPPHFLVYLAFFNLVIGNIIVLFISMISTLPRKNYDLILYALLCPVYWMFQSFAAYKAAWQLITKPFYWEKTNHGISKKAVMPQTASAPEEELELVVVKNSRVKQEIE